MSRRRRYRRLRRSEVWQFTVDMLIIAAVSALLLPISMAIIDLAEWVAGR